MSISSIYVDLTKPISDYVKMLKYRLNRLSVNLYKNIFRQKIIIYKLYKKIFIFVYTYIFILLY